MFRRFLKQGDGASLIEATVVTPFIIFLALGIFEFGNVLYQHHLITTGIRDAARYLARVPNPTDNEAEAMRIAVTGSSVTGGDKRVSWWNTTDINISYRNIANPINPGTGERTYRGENPLRIVRVTTNVSYNGLGFLNILGLGSTLDFSMSHEERHIGN